LRDGTPPELHRREDEEKVTEKIRLTQYAAKSG